MAGNLVLFNGVQVSDSPPGQVGRYKRLRAGAWQSARILLYVYASFPRVWPAGTQSSRRTDANNQTFQYRWTNWVRTLTNMRKDCGSWAKLANHLISKHGSRLSFKDVADTAKAIIELAVRDAEIERNSYSSQGSSLTPYWSGGGGGGASSSSSSRNHLQAEQAFMGRVRRAVSNHSASIERCIYSALACKNASVVHNIARTAPRGNAAHSVLTTF